MENINFDCLSPNDAKGYYFEVRVQKELLDLDIEFIGNPRDPILWKKNVANGADIVIPWLDVVVECKAVYSKVWPSGIVPNYIKRFSGSKHKIVVTNDLRMFNPKCKQILTHAGIRLMNIYYFLQWISKLIYTNKKANNITLYINDYSIRLYCSKVFNGNFTVYGKEKSLGCANLTHEILTPCKATNSLESDKHPGSVQQENREASSNSIDSDREIVKCNNSKHGKGQSKRIIPLKSESSEGHGLGL